MIDVRTMENAPSAASLLLTTFTCTLRHFHSKGELGQIFILISFCLSAETQGVGSGLKRTQAIEMTILRHFKGFYLSVDCFQGSEIDIISIRLETAINFC